MLASPSQSPMACALNMCVPPQPEQRNWLMSDPTFGLDGSITTEQACTAVGGHFKPHLAGWMIHVYPFETESSQGLEPWHGDDTQRSTNRCPS